MELTVVHVSGKEDQYRDQINYLLRSSGIFANILSFNAQGMERFLVWVGLKPDLVLVNYSLENLGDGVELAWKLKENEIPVIIVGAAFVRGFYPADECLVRTDLPRDLVPLIRRRLIL